MWRCDVLREGRETKSCENCSSKEYKMSNEISPDRMVMTILEAHVPSEKWAALQQKYSQSINRLPPQMVQTFLTQGTADPTLWQGISVWHSREALAEYRQSVETPEGIAM